jgi:hypothetical protein
MQPRNFVILAAIAGISVGLATAALVVSDAPLTSTSLNRPLAPDLAAKVNDVVRIEISGPDGRTTLERHEGRGWTVAEKKGFAADQRAVVTLLRKLGELRIVEPKTALPERLARLELEDPAGESARSRRVVLQEAGGQPVADLVVGKRAFGVFGPGRAGTYVRLADESQAWLSDGDLTPSGDPDEWIDSDIVDLSADRVKLVSLEPQDGVLITTSRTSPDDANFDLAGVPAGQVADQAKLTELSQLFAQLTLMDVRPVAEIAFYAAPQRVRVETFDGLTVVFTWLSQPDASWLRVDTVTAADTASQEVKDEAARIAAHTSGWAFEVGGYVTEQLGQKLDDLLEQPDES